MINWIKQIYNRHRKKIWKAILCIALFLILLRVLNSMSERANEKKINEALNEQNQAGYTEFKIDNQSKKIESNTSIYNYEVTEKEIENTEKILDQFFDYCNSKKIEQAYEMLTNECKETCYPTVDIFEKNYYNNIFKGEKRIYSYRKWNINTYLVNIENDILEAGKITEDNKKKVDYITIVDDKLNISTYVGRENINKLESKDFGVSILVKSKDTFMNYEIYNLEITNNSDKNISLGSNQSSKNIYLVDSNENKYEVYNHEIAPDELNIDKNSTKRISLKFASNYIWDKKIKQIVFSEALLSSEVEKLVIEL